MNIIDRHKEEELGLHKLPEIEILSLKTEEKISAQKWRTTW
jgi:hypothetical protein